MLDRRQLIVGGAIAAGVASLPKLVSAKTEATLHMPDSFARRQSNGVILIRTREIDPRPEHFYSGEWLKEEFGIVPQEYKFSVERWKSESADKTKEPRFGKYDTFCWWEDYIVNVTKMPFEEAKIFSNIDKAILFNVERAANRVAKETRRGRANRLLVHTDHYDTQLTKFWSGQKPYTNRSFSTISHPGLKNAAFVYYAGYTEADRAVGIIDNKHLVLNRAPNGNGYAYGRLITDIPEEAWSRNVG